MLGRTRTGATDPVAETERWFARRGLPQFIQGYESKAGVWNRAAPVLVGILALQLGLSSLIVVLAYLSEGDGETIGLAVLASVLGALGVLVVYIGWSRARRGTWLAQPRLGRWPLIAAFLVLPGLAVLPLQGEVGPILSNVLGQLTILLLVYGATRWTVVPLGMWATRQTIEHFRSLYRVIIKALPLLLVAVMVLFTTTETWQIAAELEPLWMWLSIGLLLALALLVAGDRTRGLVRGLEPNRPLPEVLQSCAQSPLTAADLSGLGPLPQQRLARAQTANLWFAAVSITAIQVALIAAVTWLFFMVFGALAVTIPTQQAWLGPEFSEIVVLSLGSEHGVTRELIRASTFMAGFSAFYLVVAAQSGDTYREAFDDDIGADLQQSLDVRRAYLALRPEEDGAGTA